MNIPKITFILCCILLLPASVMAQSSSGKMEGVVRDKETGEILVGAYITIDSENLKCITDEKGKFSFQRIPEGTCSVSVSFLGYDHLTKNVTVKGNDVAKANFDLVSSTNDLDEVVVTAKTEPADGKKKGCPSA